MIDWNQREIDRLVSVRVGIVTDRVRTLIQQRVSFPLTGGVDEIVAGPEGVLAEYGSPETPSKPWVFEGIRSAFGGGHE